MGEERGVGGVGEAGVEEGFEAACGTGEIVDSTDVGLEGHGRSLEEVRPCAATSWGTGLRVLLPLVANQIELGTPRGLSTSYTPRQCRQVTK